MKTIKVSWDNVEIAFERNSPELHSYIDCETGDVLVAVDGLAEDAETRRLVSASPERHVRIDPASSREQYRWMERFVATVEEPQLRDRLLIAIDGKGAFRRFKDVLLSYPADRERWFNYRANLLHYHINQWFEGKGLCTEPAPPWGAVELPPEPDEAADRVPSPGQGPAEILRLQVKALVDGLPACELYSARVFLEYLRDRGSAELAAAAKIEPRDPRDPRDPARKPLAALAPRLPVDDSNNDDDLGGDPDDDGEESSAPDQATVAAAPTTDLLQT